MSQYVGQQLFHLDVRPKRAGYLVRTNSKTQFRDAVERACSRWGGIHEPIIPVSARGRIHPAWRQIFEVLDPDILFDVADLDHASRQEAAKQLGILADPVSAESGYSSGAHPLIVEFQDRIAYASSQSKPSAVAGPGLFASGDDAHEWMRQRVRIVPSGNDVDSAMNQIQGMTIIEATGVQCGEVALEGVMSGFALIWIAEKSSLKDALWFWNIRALMSRSLSPLKAALVTPEAAINQLFTLTLDKLKLGQKWTTPDVLLQSLSIEKERLRSIGSAMGLSLLDDNSRVSFHLGGTRRTDEPLTGLIQVDPRQFLLGNREVGVRSTSVVAVEQPTTVLRLASPVSFVNRGGRLRARVSGPLLRVPHRDSVANLFHRNGSWKQGGLEIETSPMDVYHLEISVPSPHAVLCEALSSAGLRFELSQPGRLADAVTGLLKPDMRLFAYADMRAVVAALTTKRSKTLARAIRRLERGLDGRAAAVIADRVGSQLAQVAYPVNSVASITGISLRDAAELLERLARLGLAERGLLVRCDKCNLRPFVPLQVTSLASMCPACRSQAAYATNDAGEIQVYYRLNALLDRASDQGVIAHMFVMDQLAPDPTTSHFVLGAQIHEEKNNLGEVDLLGYDAHQVMCGEIKTSLARLTLSEITKTIDLALRMNADTVIFGCMEEIAQELVEVIAERCHRQDLETRLVDPTGCVFRHIGRPCSRQWPNSPLKCLESQHR